MVCYCLYVSNSCKVNGNKTTRFQTTEGEYRIRYLEIQINLSSKGKWDTYGQLRWDWKGEIKLGGGGKRDEGRQFWEK